MPILREYTYPLWRRVEEAENYLSGRDSVFEAGIVCLGECIANVQSGNFPAKEGDLWQGEMSKSVEQRPKGGRRRQACEGGRSATIPTFTSHAV